MSEIAMLLPFFVILAAGLLAIGYMCWQGLKVQEAANLAARIQGQERVAGGFAPANNPQAGTRLIEIDNGTDGGGDTMPNASRIRQLRNDPDALSGLKRAPTGGVYGKLYKAVHAMFGAGEQQKLFVPTPETGIMTDTVHVMRVMNPPKVLGMQIRPVTVEATAYGGEDSMMYGLPRWGRSSNSPGQFYQTVITDPNKE